MYHYIEGGKGGYRSRFTGNKTALSQFMQNRTLAFHASGKIKENALENHGLNGDYGNHDSREKIKRADHGS